jgi:predicted RNase H-like nuclease
VVIGVDGWRGGWVAVALDGAGVSVTAHATFAGVLDVAAGAAVIGVDIPIGLPDTPDRPADVAARAALAPHSSRVFPTFPRRILEAPSHSEAVLRCGEGPKISSQSFALRAKILEVDAHRSDPRIHEVHPELSFAAMGGLPLPSKRSWNGASARRRLLAEVGIEIADELGDAGRVPPDDVLDAAAAAWTAGRIALGQAICLPADPPLLDGRHVAIWV